MTSQKISYVFKVIKNPNNTFREIYQNADNYFKTSIIILVLSSFFTVTFTFNGISEFSTNELGYILDAEIQIINHTVNILSGFLFVVLVFFVGKKFGGSKNFRGLFSVLSYSVIPILIGGIIVSIFLYYPPLLESVSGIDSEDPIFPMLFWVLYLGIFFPFSIWSLILSIKAIKIANNFGTWKTIGIIILAMIIMSLIWVPFFHLNLIDHPYFDVVDYDDPSIIRQQSVNNYVGLSHDPNRVVDVLWDAFSTNNTDPSSINAYTDYETPEELFDRFQTIMWELDRISMISDEMVVIDYLNDKIPDLQKQTDVLIFNDVTKQKLLSIFESVKLNSQISEMKALSISEDEANETIAQTEFFIENYIDELNAIRDNSSEDVEILLIKAKQISTDSKKRDTETIELISGNSLFFTSKLIDQMKKYVDETRLIIQKMRDLGFDVTISAEHEDHMTGILENASRTMPNTKTFEITSIDSFEECVAAGNPVMESYPRQCKTSDGKHFIEEIG